ncbi:MAG: methyltransferase [Halioglobus sp.]|jgi:predicted methyltransferase|uniref:class I SAM-dependent methyltransferase n=1 Tax=Halioglobus sp. Uisw_031 TaxID=3230977 RepID=UPI003591E305
MSILRTCLLVISLALTGLIQTAYAVTETDTLNAVLASRSDEDKVRDDARQPLETLTFFQIKPGMTIAEALPGGGWYTRILANYLGQDGTLYGVNYPDSLWPMLSYASPEWIAERIAATQNFTAKVATFTDNGITAQGFTFDTVPPEVEGTVDRVLLIRALHNLNRFQQKAGTRSQALAATHAMLKQDGLVGVVQHRAPATASKEWADGNKGYLNEVAVIAMFAEAGFALVAQSEINANPMDQPSGEDNVWQLPPSLRGNSDDEQRDAMVAIGESDRMTLLFRKAP